MNRALFCLFVLVIAGCAARKSEPTTAGRQPLMSQCADGRCPKVPERSRAWGELSEVEQARRTLGLENGPGPRQEDATPLPPDDDAFVRQCDKEGDPGCLKLATKCKSAWQSDPVCQPFTTRCGQGWIGAIEPACRLAFEDALDELNSWVESHTPNLRVPVSSVRPDR